MTDTVQSFSDMLRDALGERIDRAEDGFIGMLAEHAVMEFPYAPAGLPSQIEGKRAIAMYLGSLSRLLAIYRIGAPTIHQTSDPDLTILEFDGSGHGVESGAAYEQRYISVIRTRDGRIVHYRDYWNPLAILAAVNGPSIDDVFTVKGLDRG